jgi:formamidopyrimidine-DNA glycosylase
MKHRWNKGKKDANVLPNGNKIIHLKVGGRTSAVVPAVQKKTGPVAGDIDEEGEEKPKGKGKKGKAVAKKEGSDDDDAKAEKEEKPKTKGQKRKAPIKDESNAEDEAEEGEGEEKSEPAKKKAANGANGVKKEPKASTKIKEKNEKSTDRRRSGRGAASKSYEEVDEDSD